MKTQQVNLRLDTKLLTAIQTAADAERLDRGSMIRKLLLESLEQWRLQHALRLYQSGEISLGRASETSGRSYYEMLELIKAHGIARRLDDDDSVSRLETYLRKGEPRVAEAAPPYALRAGRGPGPRPARRLKRTEHEPKARGGRPKSAGPDTLPDFPPRAGGILLVGINPAPASVARGHYYQGKLGRRLWQRLERLGLLRDAIPGHEDMAFVRDGHGLTDVVKLATRSASELTIEDFAKGVAEFRVKVRGWRPQLVVFAYKRAAEVAVGMRGLAAGPCGEVEGVPAFLLSGPYAPAAQTRRVNHMLLEALGRPAAEG